MVASLDHIVAATRRRIAKSKRSADLAGLERQAQKHTPRGFRSKLEKAAESGVAIIAELKKASPSKGLIRSKFDAAVLAEGLESAGAAALSGRRGGEFFHGSMEKRGQCSA